MNTRHAKSPAAILNQLCLHPRLSGTRRIDVKQSALKERGGIEAIEGKIEVGGYNFTLQIGLDESFPDSLPLISVDLANDFGLIPHVEQDGFVCYTPREGMLLDRHNPIGIVFDAVDRAISTLEQGLRGDNNGDFIDEFDAYWRRLNDVSKVTSFVEPTDIARRITAAKSISGGDGVFLFVSDDRRSVVDYLNDRELKPYTSTNALYVPLQPEAFMMPPERNSFWSIADIRQLVYSNLSSDNRRRLKKLTKKWKRDELVIFRLPRPSGGSVLFGIHYIGVENCHPLLSGSDARQLKPFQLDRRDKEYLLPRSGANVKLANKRVALIGCGSVGGFLAFELIRSGVLNMMLVDPDNLSAENTFRHVLGKEGIDTPKVVGLKQEIIRKFPYVDIEIIVDRIETVLTDGRFLPRDYDLIIIALGDDTISLSLNDFLIRRAGTPPVLFTWLEPYGIGGHALLSNNSESKGCLECLFTPVEGDDQARLHNRAAFAAPEQSFTKDLTGCGSLYTPYSASDAVQTAILAVRLAVETLLGEVEGNPLISWKGRSREFDHAGFTLSSRYDLHQEQLSKPCYEYYNPNCPVCGREG
jgi:molybdopterin/thiamine biosynthesis adenylyltransferase